MYQLFEFQPCAGILDTEMDVGVVDIRPTRNLAKLTQIVGKFEYLHRVDVLDTGEYRGKRRIDQNEVDVSLVKPDYIIEGKVDLIRGEGYTVEIVDYKSQRKPDIVKDREQLERYRRQAPYLCSPRRETYRAESYIYYTGEDSSVPTITRTRSLLRKARWRYLMRR